MDLGGLRVPDAGPVFLAALGVHVASALTCGIAGALAATARKRPGRHTRSGVVYLYGMAVVYATATVMAAQRLAPGLAPVPHRDGGLRTGGHRLVDAPPPSSTVDGPARLGDGRLLCRPVHRLLCGQRTAPAAVGPPAARALLAGTGGRGYSPDGAGAASQWGGRPCGGPPTVRRFGVHAQVRYPRPPAPPVPSSVRPTRPRSRCPAAG